MISALEELRPRLRGPLSLPGEPSYAAARALWNGMIDRHPAGIAHCLGVADVVACVEHARRHALTLAVKGGGHNIAGLAVADDALLIDTSLMRGVWVDPGARTAHAQPGCVLGDVDRETQLHGLAAPLGFVSTTGIAGLTLGGGFGYLTRRFGWSCDNVLSMQVVTADGRVVRASESEHADLLWALRGGGGNFGVVTDFHYRLYPVGPDVLAGLIAWRGDAGLRALELARSMMEEEPPELVCVPILRRAPPAAWLPKDMHGCPIAMLAVCDSGAVPEAERRAAKIKAFGQPIADIIERRRYTSQQSIVDATQPRGRRYYWKSEYLPRLDDALFEGVLAHAARMVSPHSSIVLFPIGGAVGRLELARSAVGNRDASWVLIIMASWEEAHEDADNIEWARSAWRDLRSFSTGGTYVNFLTADEDPGRTRAAYGIHFDRLRDLKTAWDPANLFHCNRNIAPRPAHHAAGTLHISQDDDAALTRRGGA